MSLPNLGHYILELNPSTVSAETASVVSPFQVAIVLGKKENFSSSVYAFGRWYWKGWDLVLLLPSASDSYLSLSTVTRLLCILQKKVKEACCLRSWRSFHWSSASISLTWLWLRQRLQAQRAAVLTEWHLATLNFMNHASSHWANIYSNHPGVYLLVIWPSNIALKDTVICKRADFGVYVIRKVIYQ